MEDLVSASMENKNLAARIAEYLCSICENRIRVMHRCKDSNISARGKDDENIVYIVTESDQNDTVGVIRILDHFAEKVM